MARCSVCEVESGVIVDGMCLECSNSPCATTKLNVALVALDRACASSQDERVSLMRAKVRGLMRGYDARWRHVPLTVLGVEETITSDLWNPETGRKSRSFTLAGKIDVRAMDGDSRIIIDHKTTSEEITDPSAPYWRQLVVESQPTHYMLLEWLNGRKIDMALWDVVRKPSIAPKNVAKKDREVIIATGEYFGRLLSPESLEELAATERESLEMYEYRLTQDCTLDRPERYFQRRSVPRLDSEVIEHAKEVWEEGQELLHIRQMERHTRNAGACMLYGRPCKFLGICSGHDAPDSGKWSEKQWRHAELPILNSGSGVAALTKSRLSTFKTCKRKHYYDYELGLERVEEDEAEALLFGTLWHIAQEAWWGFDLINQSTERKTYGNATAPVIEAGAAADSTGFPC